MIRIPVAELRPGSLRLDPATSRYLLKVHRLAEGEQIEAFSPEQELIATARLVKAELPSALIEVGAVSKSSKKLPDVCLIQCVGKNDKPEEAVKDATVYGARSVLFAIAQRSVAKAQGSHRIERWRRISADAARQCERDSLPSIQAPRALGECLREVGGDSKEVRLVCAWHEESVPLLAALDEADLLTTRVVLLVGPEGGLSTEELSLALEQGFQPVSLGGLVLRTEAATSLALSACALRFDQQLRDSL